MTETELTDRLRESIVLDGPDAWKTNGYLQDAQQVGLSLADALKKANGISQEVANNSLLFQNIQARIARMAQPSRSQFIDQDLNQIVNAASSLKLSPDFVKNQWVPTVLQRLAPKSAPIGSEPMVSSPAAKVDTVVPEPVVVSPAAKSSTFDELLNSKPEPAKPDVQETSVRLPETFVLPVAPKVVEQTIPEPPPVVHSFTATPARVHKGQPVTLEWDVENLLAVTIDDLGEGLSPKNRGWVKPSKSMDYTLFDVNNNPLSTVRVDVIPRDRSGVYGVLFALALLAIIYWFIKSSNTRSPTPKPTRKTEQTSGLGSARPDKSTPDEVASASQDPGPKPVPATSEATDTQEAPASTPPAIESTSSPPKEEKPALKEVPDEVVRSEPAPKVTTPADARQGKYEEAFGDKPYDKAELGADDRGWRRARSNGRWGYINEANEWVIKPEFEAVTPFRNNTASAFLNGQLITIDRNGEQVRN